MKKVTLLFLFISFVFTSGIKAQAGFSKLYSSPATYNNWTTSVTRAYDNGFVITALQDKGIFFKIDSVGNFLWGSQFNNESFNSVTKTRDFCYALTGFILDSASGHTDLLFVKINQSGDTIWSKAIADSYDDVGYHIQSTNDNGYVITGIHSDSTQSITIVKLDSAGGLEWKRNLKISNYLNSGLTLKQLPDSGYVIAANISDTSSSTSFSRPALIRLNATGAVIWARTYTKSGLNNAFMLDMLTVPDGILFMISGTTLIKTDLNGIVLWSKLYGFPSQSRYDGLTSSIEPTSDGALILMNPSSFAATQVTKVDTSGNILWFRSLIADPAELIETEDKGFLLVGEGHNNSEGALLVMKCDSAGDGLTCVYSPGGAISSSPDSIINSIVSANTAPAGTLVYPVHEPPQTLLLTNTDGCAEFSLNVKDEEKKEELSVLPNPFKSEAVLKLPGYLQHSTIQILDILGKIMLSEVLPENTLEYVIRKGVMNNGIYFLRVITENKIITKKLVIQ